jgi:hypothetical protein
MAAIDPAIRKEKLKQQYLKVSKIFLLIALIYSLWIAIVVIGVYSLSYEPKWAAFTIQQWMLSAIILLSILLILEIIFILHYLSSMRIKSKRESTQEQTYLQGKQVHNITIPNGAKGGIFSKTYILIDENRVLQLRYQMIPPHDLWGKQQ